MKTKILWCAVLLASSLSIESKSVGKDALLLPFSIAQEYHITKRSQENIISPIPDQKPTTKQVVEVAKNDKKAYIFYWVGYPQRNLGPMVKKESWPLKFLGEDAKLQNRCFYGSGAGGVGAAL